MSKHLNEQADCAAWSAGPSLHHDMPGKRDKPFGAASDNGDESFESLENRTGVDYLEFDPVTGAQGEQAQQDMARRGAETIVAAWALDAQNRSLVSAGMEAGSAAAGTTIVGDALAAADRNGKRRL